MKRALFSLLALLAFAAPAAAQGTAIVGQPVSPLTQAPTVVQSASAVNGGGTSTQAITEPAGTGTQTALVGGNIYRDFTSTGSTGAGAAADVSVYTMPAKTLATDGDHLVVNLCAKHAANTNSTTLTLVAFGTSVAASTDTTSGDVACQTLTLTRTSSSTLTYSGYGILTSFGQYHGTISGLDFTIAQTIKYTVQAATTTNDLIGNYMTVDWFP